MMTLEKFEEASEAVIKVTNRTKLIYSDYFSEMTGGRVYLKPENHIRHVRIQSFFIFLLAIIIRTVVFPIIAGTGIRPTGYGAFKSIFLVCLLH